MSSVSLALSGGGAAALGQVPVLEALDDAGVEVVAIAGTSMGAVLGAMRAAGYSGRDIRAEISRKANDLTGTGWRVLRGLNLTDEGGGLLPDPMDVVGELLPADVPEKIEDLALPLAIVATDYHGQRRHSFEKGSLRPALAASFAIPGALTPVMIEDRVFVDGGVSDNLPVAELPEGVPIVAVDAASIEASGAQDIPGPLACSLGSMRIMMRALLEARLAHDTPSILIRPASAAFGPLDFHRAQEILDAAEPSREETRRAISEMFG